MYTQVTAEIEAGKIMEEITEGGYLKPESVKLNGFAMTKKPPPLTPVGTSSQGHIGFYMWAQQQGRQGSLILKV